MNNKLLNQLSIGHDQHTDTFSFGSDNSKPETLKNKKRSLIIGHLLILVCLTMVCFGRTLSSYFLADDFCEIKYVHEALTGHPELLWSNFFGNYMQIPGMSVYRPFLLLSIVGDYILWKTNATGYYLTNIFYYTGSVVTLYLIVNMLTKDWGSKRSSHTALIAAGLFAVNPLHCENISWMVGRVDIICGFFYLLSFYLFIQPDRSAFRTACGTVAFVLALLTKEMAVGLPLILSVYYMSNANQQLQNTKAKFTTIIFVAIKKSLPLWITLVLYLVIRLICLHTIFGGYTGGFAALQEKTLVAHWLDLDTWRRFFLPFHSTAAPATSLSISYFCYLMLAILTLTKLLLGSRVSWQWVCLLCAWFFSAAVPIFQLWGLGPELEGARFYFFLSIPLAISLALLFMAPCSLSLHSKSSSKESPLFLSIDQKLLVIGTLTACILIITLSRAAYSTNLLWVHAGKEVRDLATNCQKLAQTVAASQQIIILGIPKNNAGAHMILNGNTFGNMLSEPFISKNIAQRFITFDPIMYGHDEEINCTRFKECHMSAHVIGPYIWLGRKMGFKYVRLQSNKQMPSKLPLNLPSIEHPSLSKTELSAQTQPYVFGHAQYSTANNLISMSDVKDGDGIQFSGLDVNPLDFDYLELEISTTAPSKISFSFNGEPKNITTTARINWTKVNSGGSDFGFHKVCIPLSHYWHWYASEKIGSVAIYLSDCKHAQLKNFQLSSIEGLAPHLSLEMPDLKEIPQHYGAGIFRLSEQPVKIAADLNAVSQAKSVRFEISKPNFFFDLTDSNQSSIGKTIISNQPKSELNILASQLPSSGYYQIRAICLSKSGIPLGKYSDPITVERK